MYSRGNWIQGGVGWMKPLKIWMSILDTNACFRAGSGPDLAWHFIVPEIHRIRVRAASETGLSASRWGIFVASPWRGNFSLARVILGWMWKQVVPCWTVWCHGQERRPWSRTRSEACSELSMWLWAAPRLQSPPRREVAVPASPAHGEDWQLIPARYGEGGLAHRMHSTIISTSPPSLLLLLLIIFQCFQIIFCLLESCDFSVMVIWGCVWLLCVKICSFMALCTRGINLWLKCRVYTSTLLEVVIIAFVSLVFFPL